MLTYMVLHYTSIQVCTCECVGHVFASTCIYHRCVCVVSVHVCVCMYVCVCAYKYLCVHLCVCVCIFVCVFMWMFGSVCLWVCFCLCARTNDLWMRARIEFRERISNERCWHMTSTLSALLFSIRYHVCPMGCMCVCVFVCVRESETECIRVCLCKCVCVRERGRVCVCLLLLHSCYHTHTRTGHPVDGVMRKKKITPSTPLIHHHNDEIVDELRIVILMSSNHLKMSLFSWPYMDFFFLSLYFDVSILMSLFWSLQIMWDSLQIIAHLKTYFNEWYFMPSQDVFIFMTSSHTSNHRICMSITSRPLKMLINCNHLRYLWGITDAGMPTQDRNTES